MQFYKPPQISHKMLVCSVRPRSRCLYQLQIGNWPFQQLSRWVPDVPLGSECSGPCYYLLICCSLGFVYLCLPFITFSVPCLCLCCRVAINSMPLWARYPHHPDNLTKCVSAMRHLKRNSLTKFFLCAIITRRMFRDSKKSQKFYSHQVLWNRIKKPYIQAQLDDLGIQRSISCCFSQRDSFHIWF